MICGKLYAFQVQRILVTSQHFILSLFRIFACRLVSYLCACAVEILKFQDSVYLKTRAMRTTNHKRVKKSET